MCNFLFKNKFIVKNRNTLNIPVCQSTIVSTPQISISRGCVAFKSVNTGQSKKK